MTFKHLLLFVAASIAFVLPGKAQLYAQYGTSLTFETGFNIKHMERLDVFAIVKPLGPLRFEVRQWTGPFGTEMNRKLKVGVQDVEIVSDSTRPRGTKLTAIVPPYDGFESRFQQLDSKFFILGFEGEPEGSVIMPDESLGFELKMNFGTGVKEDSTKQWIYGKIERKTSNEFCLLTHFSTNLDQLPLDESIQKRLILALESCLTSTTQPEFTRLVYLLGRAYFPDWEGSVLSQPNRSGVRSNELTKHIMDLANTLQGYRKAKLIELLVQNKVLGISEAYYNALLECKDDIHAFEEEGIQCGLPSEIREEAHRFEVDSNACVEIIVATKNIHVQATLLRDYLRSTFDENHARSLATLIPFYRKNDEALLRLLIKRLARASNDLEHRPEGREDIIAPWINKEECIRYWMEKYHVPPG